MASRTLEITLMSAKGLNNVNLFSKLAVYAVVSLSGEPKSRQRTPPDREGGRNPSWNSSISLTVPADGDLARHTLHILLRTDRLLGDRNVGEVRIPLSELLAGAGDVPMPVQLVSYQVRRVASGEPKGVLNFSYKLGERVPAPTPVPAPADSAYPPPALTMPYPPPPDSNVHEPVMAYPMLGTSSGVYPPYGAPPPYPQPYGYGYARAGYGYEYGAAPPPAVAPPQQKNNSKGMGVAAGLAGGAIGGLIVGDMISDAAAYDAGYEAGYDAGFDEAGGFEL